MKEEKAQVIVGASAYTQAASARLGGIVKGLACENPPKARWPGLL